MSHRNRFPLSGLHCWRWLKLRWSSTIGIGFLKSKPTICIFAKPPRPGQVKTRLIPVLGDELAASLARAFLLDTLSLCSELKWAKTVVTSTDPQDPYITDAAQNAALWDQGGGDLGKRLERILKRALEDAPFAVAFGSDSPGLPKERLENVKELMTVNDAVIGPCDDGGFYLLALSCCPTGLLDKLPWSSENTYASTVSRLRRFGLKVGFLEPWFDVDRPEDVTSLLRLLKAGRIRAPETELLIMAEQFIFAKLGSPDVSDVPP